MGHGVQGCIAGLSGGVFGALPRCGARIQTLHMQRHIQLPAQRLAELLKAIGGGLQAVMNVQRPDLPRPAAGASEQQGSRVRATAQGHTQWE
jgi:hypothetical protein